MASDLRGYTEQETLNKVLNTDNDSIQVDIVDATGVTITATDASVYVDDADWTDSTSSHTLVGGLYQSSPQTITNGDVGPLQVDADGALHISDGGNTITVDGTVTANLGTTDNAVLDAIDAVLDTIKIDTEAIETAVEAVNQAAEGTISATTQRVTIATDDDGVAHLATIAGAVSTQMQVDIVADGAGLATDANLALMLYGTALVVTAVHAGSDHVLGATYEAFYIGVGGDVSLDCVTSGTNIVFKNLASGQMLPVRATVVNATNTTATNIVALKA